MVVDLLADTHMLFNVIVLLTLYKYVIKFDIIMIVYLHDLILNA